MALESRYCDPSLRDNAAVNWDSGKQPNSQGGGNSGPAELESSPRATRQPFKRTPLKKLVVCPPRHQAFTFQNTGEGFREETCTV